MFLYNDNHLNLKRTIGNIRKLNQEEMIQEKKESKKKTWKNLEIYDSNLEFLSNFSKPQSREFDSKQSRARDSRLLSNRTPRLRPRTQWKIHYKTHYMTHSRTSERTSSSGSGSTIRRSMIALGFKRLEAQNLDC